LGDDPSAGAQLTPRDKPDQSEVRFKQGQDRNHSIPDFQKRGDLPVVKQAALIERYVVGDVQIHVHTRTSWTSSDQEKSADYCIVYERAGDEFVGRDANPGPSSRKTDLLNDRSGVTREPMLVEIGKFVEYQERVDDRVCPSVVWLQALNDCLVVARQRHNLSGSTSPGSF
jgi:hypothetical protein